MESYLELRNLEVRYDADFFPPMLELAYSDKQIAFVKELSKRFQLRFSDLFVNPQNLSRGFIYFKYYPAQKGFFDVFIGVDGLSINYLNPFDMKSAWEPSLNILQGLSEITTLAFSRQVLTLSSQCDSKELKASELVSRYNIFKGKNEYMKSKGVNFTFNGPVKDKSETYFSLAESALIPDGLFLWTQSTFFKEIQDFNTIFDDTVSFLVKIILPQFNLNLELA